MKSKVQKYTEYRATLIIFQDGCLKAFGLSNSEITEFLKGYIFKKYSLSFAFMSEHSLQKAAAHLVLPLMGCHYLLKNKT